MYFTAPISQCISIHTLSACGPVSMYLRRAVQRRVATSYIGIDTALLLAPRREMTAPVAARLPSTVEWRTSAVAPSVIALRTSDGGKQVEASIMPKSQNRGTEPPDRQVARRTSSEAAARTWHLSDGRLILPTYINDEPQQPRSQPSNRFRNFLCTVRFARTGKIFPCGLEMIRAFLKSAMRSLSSVHRSLAPVNCARAIMCSSFELQTSECLSSLVFSLNS